MKTLTVQSWGTMTRLNQPLEALETGKTRIKVRYAAVGRTDITAVRGGYLLVRKLPFNPGYDFMGVDEAGRRVAGLLPAMGAYREYIDVEPRWSVPIPAGVSDEAAAAMPLNYMTALWMLEQGAPLKPGDKVLVHGAGGGVGRTLVELAGQFGYKVWGLASSARKAEVEELGATLIDRHGDWIAEAKRLVPEGFRAVFDAQGTDSFRKSWKVLAKGGTLAAYGFANSLDGGISNYVNGALYLTLKGINFSGKKFSICSLPSYADRHPDWYRKSLSRLFSLVAEGKINPRVQEVFPWDHVEKAHAVIEKGRVQGKLLLDFGA